MIGTAHDFARDPRRHKAHLNRAFLKSIGLRDMAHRHRRRALRRQLKFMAHQFPVR